MSYLAASREVPPVLARHSVLDTESSRTLDTGFRRYDELAARRGE